MSPRPHLEELGDWIVDQLLAHAGVEEHPSRFADRPALFHRGREFFHLDEPGLADVRIGRASIRSHVEDLRADPNIVLRKNASDWVQMRFTSDEHAAATVALAESALRALDR